MLIIQNYCKHILSPWQYVCFLKVPKSEMCMQKEICFQISGTHLF